MLLSLLLCSAVAPVEFVIFPPTVSLTHAKASQQLLVTDTANGRTVADRTAMATFATTDAKVAVVSPAGVVTATGDGRTTITAAVNGVKITTAVTVSNFAAADAPSFLRNVVPILTRSGCNSGACHGALAGKGGFKLSLRGYDPETDFFAITRQAVARRTDLQEPANSLLLKKATRAVPHGGGERFAAESPAGDVILDWVRSGAPGPKANEAGLVKLELFPPPATLKPKDAIRVTVRAHYADGAIEDVTRWTRFGSTGDLVASVDEDGLVKVNAPGEAAVTANFGTKVAVLPITVPYPAPADYAAFDKSPKHNFIDDHVLRKLRSLNVPPSPPCTDAEFIRRAYLDATGTLPKPETVAAFLAEKSSDKRSKLIDTLLDSPAYVDYWAYKWSDLLLVSSRKLSQPAMWAFYRFVRQAVADNSPWDRFARNILLASGSSLSNGAANYFVLHKEVTEIVEATAVTFLGMSVNCARCHNHPLEKWTQDQYWATANLFGRVGLKNGDRGGEVFLTPLPTGEVFHLRKGTATPPAPLDGKPMPADYTGDRRAYFADWLTAKDNPYFAKAVANRVWKNFLGRGLVDPEDDLRDTNPATNVELLDALAAAFVANKYDVKRLCRLVMNSAAYQRSAVSLPTNTADDRFYSRYFVRRLSAEVIADAYSDVTGVPTDFSVLSLGPSGGEQKSTSYPLGTRAMQLPDSLLVSQFLDNFGRAERQQTCSCERTADSSVTQALHLNNGGTLNMKLRDPKSRLTGWVPKPDAAVIDDLFQVALGRPAMAAESKKLTAVLSAAGTDAVARREAIEDLTWAVLTSPEFLFNR